MTAVIVDMMVMMGGITVVAVTKAWSQVARILELRVGRAGRSKEGTADDLEGCEDNISRAGPSLFSD